MYSDKIIVAGFGGQGALRIGQMLAVAAIDLGYEAEWLPSYGAEMRGGTANCNVTISDSRIPFAMISKADSCIIMNDMSMEKFADKLKSEGILLVNSDMVTVPSGREDVREYFVPSDTIAEKNGNPRGSNMVLLGAYLAITKKIKLESVYRIIENSFTGSKTKYVEPNKNCVKDGFDCIVKQQRNQAEENNEKIL